MLTHRLPNGVMQLKGSDAPVSHDVPPRLKFSCEYVPTTFWSVIVMESPTSTAVAGVIENEKEFWVGCTVTAGAAGAPTGSPTPVQAAGGLPSPPAEHTLTVRFHGAGFPGASCLLGIVQVESMYGEGV